MDTNFKFNYMIDNNNMVNVLHNEVFGPKNGFISTIIMLLCLIFFLNIVICFTGLFYSILFIINFTKNNFSSELLMSIVISSALTISFMNIYLTLVEADLAIKKMNEEINMMRTVNESKINNTNEDNQDTDTDDQDNQDTDNQDTNEDNQDTNKDNQDTNEQDNQDTNVKKYDTNNQEITPISSEDEYQKI